MLLFTDFQSCYTLAIFRSTVKGLKTQKAEKNSIQSFHALRCLIFHLALSARPFFQPKRRYQNINSSEVFFSEGCQPLQGIPLLCLVKTTPILRIFYI